MFTLFWFLSLSLSESVILLQVPLGVQPKQETVDILEHYKQYLPSKTVQLNEKIPGSEDTEDAAYIKTLLGGDYLSVARVRGAQSIKEQQN